MASKEVDIEMPEIKGDESTDLPAVRKSSNEKIVDPSLQRVRESEIDGPADASSERTRSPIKGHRPALPFLNEIRGRRPSGSAFARKPSRGLPFIKELAASHLKGAQESVSYANDDVTPTSEVSRSPIPLGVEETKGILKTGNLIKTSRARNEKSTPGPPRPRKFKLTHESLDYLHHFSQAKVKRSYPLTAVEDIQYEEGSTFKLLFSSYIMTLQAENETEARDWVEKLTKAWSQWRVIGGTIIRDPNDHQESYIDEIIYNNDDDDEHTPLEEPATPLEEREVKKEAEVVIPQRYGSKPRERSHSLNPSFLRRESSSNDVGCGTYDNRRHRGSRKAFRIARLKPQLERTDLRMVQDPQRDHDPSQDQLHQEFSMIKYPNKILRLPGERIFTVDEDNLQILWRISTGTGYSQKRSLSLRRVVEVRTGQQTPQFDKFPYEQVEDQSFSLLYESESNKYAKLVSLDLICDHIEHFNKWIDGLKTLVSATQWLKIFPPRYENTDPTILWLKQIWACKSENHEMKESDAIRLAKKFIPTLTDTDAKTIIKLSHKFQFKHTFNYGAALRWDGLVLLFNLLCDSTHSQLHKLFLEYAHEYPDLGLTLEEFKKFLIRECHWSPRDCKQSVLQALMKNHDDHYQAYKKFTASNKAEKYLIATKLFSFAGLVSFLRSKDNSIINLEHETVYQDMTQPLSHYFINSSHNTYLEGDQVTGTSSTDAYVRALLQGCRCVEIDCWDGQIYVDGLPGKEPIIYHGHTLTTKIPFRDVIHTINNYGFNSSLYPIVISIENHCSSSQQSKMAKIFRAIFQDRLPRENLVELEGRERLPSPEELQGKIILKGSYRNKDTKNGKTGTAARKMKRLRTTELNLATDRFESSLTNQTVKSKVRVEEDQVDWFGRGRYNRRSFRLRTRDIRDCVSQEEQGQDDQELIFTQTAKDLSDLIVYCRSLSIKPWDWKKQKATSVSEMFSFGEPTALDLCKRYPRDVLCCSERQMVRTYPKGTRFDSSNYNPMHMWVCGIQLAAINFQYPSLEMHLNQGFFRINGGCGYVLKPLVMRREDPGGTGEKGASRAPYNPLMGVPHPEVPPLQLEIELLSGQRLSSWKKTCNSLTVDIHTYGIQHDTTRMKQANHTRSFSPSWGKGEHILKHQILMPEICLVYFRVENEGRRVYGQNCFHVTSLIPGIKFVPLRTNGGELIPESGLFVCIKINRETDLSLEKGNGLFPIAEEALPTVEEDDHLQKNGTTLGGRPRFITSADETKIIKEPVGRRVTSPPVLQSYKSSDASDSTSRQESALKAKEIEVIVEIENGTLEVKNSPE